MRRRAFSVIFTLLFLLGAGEAAAQYYSWGPSPASVRWKKLTTPDVRLIYPADFEYNARRVMWYLDTVRSHIGFGFRHGTMSTPVVIHNRNMGGNGMVMWAPKRIELLAAPVAPYSEPWLKQLAVHEYRHNVQFNNLRRSTNRALTWLLGEQIAFLGNGQFSIFIIEGDAVMAETEMSAFGRGLQPSFTMHYRAMGSPTARGRVGGPEYSGDYWFCGSYRDHVPDHYRLGYQLVGRCYDHFGSFIWDDVAHYVARNPQFIVPLAVRLKKKYGFSQTELFRRAFADLNSHWDSLPRIPDSSRRIVTPESSYTTYQWPLWLDEGTLVAFKSDLDRTWRIVRVDTATGSEEILTYTGIVSSRPALSGGTLLWTELRPSLLWAEGVNSRLCAYDFATGRKRVVNAAGGQVLYPVQLPDGESARVEYDWSGRFSIVRGAGRLELPLHIEITGLAWDEATGSLYFAGLDDGGMFFASADVAAASWQRLTPSRHITISDLRAGGGRLYFGSIVSGRDEAHCLDLATGVEFRLTESTYGSFQPSPSADGSTIALTTYDHEGYHLATQHTSSASVQPRRELPVDLVNPQWKRWDLPRLDSMVYSASDAERSATAPKPRRYRKLLNIFRPHSWLPAAFYPPGAIQEMDRSMTLGATVISQSLLSDAVSWLSYGWTRPRDRGEGGSVLRGGLSYSGLGPVLDIDFTWGGGNQTFYTIIPKELNLSPKRYFSVTTRLSLPMTVSSGYWVGRLTPSAEYFYTNGLIFEPHASTGVEPVTGKLTRGVERLMLAVGYSGQTRLAHKEFLPRWGLSARATFVTNPTNDDFSNLFSASLAGWLPGVVRPHSTTLRFAWQQSAGRGNAPFMFRMKDVFPRGAEYGFSAQRWASGSLDYQFPVWYPEGGWTSVIYFKRVRLNLFADYARWQDFDGRWRPLFSWGGDVILDVNPMRMPATNRAIVKLTLASPSDRPGLFFNFGLELPL